MKHSPNLLSKRTLASLKKSRTAKYWAGSGLVSAQLLIILGGSHPAYASEAAASENLTTANAVVSNADAISTSAAYSEEANGQQFDTDILTARGLQSDLGNYFRNAAHFSPGKNIIDVSINGVVIGRKTAYFSRAGELCFSPSFLNSVGLIAADKAVMTGVEKSTAKTIAVNSDAFGALSPVADADTFLDPSACPTAKAVSAQTIVSLDSSKMSVDIATPEDTLKGLPAAQLEQGGNAAVFNYRASIFASTSANQSTSVFTQVDSQAGFNVDDWIVRSNQSYSIHNGKSNLHFTNAFAQKTFVDEKQTLQAGLIYTQSHLFGGIPIVGAQWFPESALLGQKKYPVTGVAATRARVIITQNNVILLSTVVPPGPFKLTEYLQGNRTGDLQVQVIEETGAEQRFTIAAADLLLGDGNGISSGVYAAAGMLSTLDTGLRSVPVLTMEKSWQYGTKVGLSTGALLAGKYASIGAAVSGQQELLGHVSGYAQVLAARDVRDDATGMLVSTSLAWSNTNNLIFGLSMVERTAQYRSAQEAQTEIAPTYGVLSQSFRTQLGSNFGWNSQLFGTFNASFTHQNFFTDVSSNTYTLGWSTGIGKARVSVGVARTLQTASATVLTTKANNSLYASLYMPLGDDATLTSNVRQNNYSGQQNTVVDTSISQRLNDSLNYQATIEKDLSASASDTKSLSVSGVPRYTSVSVGATVSPGMKNYFTQFSGGVIINGQGASFSPTAIQDTFAVVKLGDVAGIPLDTQVGTVWSGFNGLAAIPSLSPFSDASLEIATNKLPPNVEVDQAVRVMRATRGAVINLDIAARKIQRVLVSVTYNGEQLPERLAVFRNDNEFFATTTEDGRIMFNDWKEDDVYSIKLLDGMSCKLGHVNLSNAVAGGNFQHGDAMCQSEAKS